MTKESVGQAIARKRKEKEEKKAKEEASKGNTASKYDTATGKTVYYDPTIPTVWVGSKEEMQQVQKEILAEGYNPSGSTSSRQAVAEAQGQVKSDIRNTVAYKNYIEALKQRGFTQQQIDTYKPETVQQIQEYQNQNTQEGINKYNEARMQELLQAQQQKLKTAREKTIQQQYIEQGIYTPDVINSYRDVDKSSPADVINVTRQASTLVPTSSDIPEYEYQKLVGEREKSILTSTKTNQMLLARGIQEKEEKFTLRNEPIKLFAVSTAGTVATMGLHPIETAKEFVKYTFTAVTPFFGSSLNYQVNVINEGEKSYKSSKPKALGELAGSLLFFKGAEAGLKALPRPKIESFDIGGRDVSVLGVTTKKGRAVVLGSKIKSPEVVEFGFGSPNVFKYIEGETFMMTEGALKTKVLQTNIVKYVPENIKLKSPIEVEQIPIQQTIIRDIGNKKSSFINEENINTATERLPPVGVQVFLDVAKEERLKLFGSKSRDVQLARDYQINKQQYKLNKIPRDIEFKSNELKSLEDSQRITDKTITLLKEKGKVNYGGEVFDFTTVKEIKDTPFALEMKVNGKYEKISEFKLMEEPLKEGELPVSEYVAGIKKEGKPLNIKGNKITPLSEEMRNVADNLLTLNVKELTPKTNKYFSLTKEQIKEGLEFHHTDYVNNKGNILTKEEHSLFHDIDTGKVKATTPEQMYFYEQNKITSPKQLELSFFPKEKRVKDIGSWVVSARTEQMSLSKLNPYKGRVLKNIERVESFYPEELIREQLKLTSDRRQLIADFTTIKKEPSFSLSGSSIISSKWSPMSIVPKSLSPYKSSSASVSPSISIFMSSSPSPSISVSPSPSISVSPSPSVSMSSSPSPSRSVSPSPSISVSPSPSISRSPSPSRSVSSSPSVSVSPPPISISPSPSISRSPSPSSKQKEKGYNVYMKEYKKVVKANEKPLPYTEAVRLGQDVADNSLSASYKISDARVNVNKATRSKYATNNFNPNNFVKSSKQTGWFIEKKNKRLDTAGERKGITASKLLSQRRKAMMQNKVIKWGF